MAPTLVRAGISQQRRIVARMEILLGRVLALRMVAERRELLQGKVLRSVLE